MPYIDKESRKKLDEQIDALLNALKLHPVVDGQVNYCISRLLLGLYDQKYSDINRAIGVLECVKQEYYRKFAGPYENLKASENGDIFPLEEKPRGGSYLRAVGTPQSPKGTHLTSLSASPSTPDKPYICHYMRLPATGEFCGCLNLKPDNTCDSPCCRIEDKIQGPSSIQVDERVEADETATALHDCPMRDCPDYDHENKCYESPDLCKHLKARCPQAGKVNPDCTRCEFCKGLNWEACDHLTPLSMDCPNCKTPMVKNHYRDIAQKLCYQWHCHSCDYQDPVRHKEAEPVPNATFCSGKDEMGHLIGSVGCFDRGDGICKYCNGVVPEHIRLPKDPKDRQMRKLQCEILDLEYYLQCEQQDKAELISMSSKEFQAKNLKDNIALKREVRKLLQQLTDEINKRHEREAERDKALYNLKKARGKRKK